MRYTLHYIQRHSIRPSSLFVIISRVGDGYHAISFVKRRLTVSKSRSQQQQKKASWLCTLCTDDYLRGDEVEMLEELEAAVGEPADMVHNDNVGKLCFCLLGLARRRRAGLSSVG
eukprot:scaffold19121_cov66-Cyclotella_meneghiniana.AAC.2